MKQRVFTRQEQVDVVRRCYSYQCQKIILDHHVTCLPDNEIIHKSRVVSSSSEDYPVGSYVSDLTDFVEKEVDCFARDRWILQEAFTATENYTVPADITGLHVQNISATDVDIEVNSWPVKAGEEYGGTFEANNDMAITDRPILVAIPSGGEARIQWYNFAGYPCLEPWVDDTLKVGIPTTVDAMPADLLCDEQGVASYSVSNVVNATVTSNGDGTYEVTPDANACGDSWSFDRTVTCASGEIASAAVSGEVEDILTSHSFSTANESTANIGITLSNDGDYTIDWGDGFVETFSSDSGYHSHSYASSYSGNVIIEHSTCGVITEFKSTQGHWDFDISTLPQSLTYYQNTGNNTVPGDIGALPSGLTYFFSAGQNVTSGDIADLPAGLTYYSNTGYNTTSGDIGDLPSVLTYYSNVGQNTTLGDIGTLPAGLVYYYNSGKNTTHGDIGDLTSSLTKYYNYGQNTTIGDLGTLPSGLTHYYNYGRNTVSGDVGGLPSGLTHFYNYGLNTASGDIGGLPSSVAYFYNYGQNTTFGDVGSLPAGIIHYYNVGQNTTSGDVGTLPTGITNYYNYGQNTTTSLTNIPSSVKAFYDMRSGSSSFTQEGVDRILAQLVAAGLTNGRLDVRGPHSPPSATGVADAATLVSRGFKNSANSTPLTN